MWGSKPLLTVSTADISVLHSAEVVHFHHNSRKSSEELWIQPCICADQAQYHTPEVWLHRDAMRLLQRITICTHWSLAFYGTSEDDASFTRSSNIDNPKSTNQTPQAWHIDHIITCPRPKPCSIVIVRFSWVVLHVPIKSYHLVIKA